MVPSVGKDPFWWDRDLDLAGRPIRPDVRAAARGLGQRLEADDLRFVRRTAKPRGYVDLSCPALFEQYNTILSCSSSIIF
jgi:hypothetical protein